MSERQDQLWEQVWQTLRDAGMRYDVVHVPDDPTILGGGDGDRSYDFHRDRLRLTVGAWGAAVADLDTGDVQTFADVGQAVAHMLSRRKP